MKLVELGKEIPKPEVGKEAHEPEVGKEAKEIELIQMKDISGENKNKDSFSGQLKNGKPRNKDEKVEDESEDDKTEDEGIEDERTEVERMKDEKKINGKMIEKTEKIEKLEKIVKTTKVEGEKPTKEEREYILSKVTELQEQFNPVDFKEIINNKNYFNRFWFHAYHMPGDQIENCKNLIINSLRWREEFGVRGITEDDIDPMDKKVGGVFARNRDRSGSKLLVVTVRKHYKDSTKSLVRTVISGVCKNR
ncbi:uncharacterized protein LOC111716623 [Eurytemora carolleeae]|uniref:uncharacterized protein LOC111716623 n=1 Tax=Eurytemora carolleeae TaxID=1294199 RepID=UPI000C757C64|nr:uncharacterized protein LOC111716623 [Eurytemora carolleeae]|eukprot:XP_023347865.1 uncharacterized protein LOC111716623 [Eurytemora affinis]